MGLYTKDRLPEAFSCFKKISELYKEGIYKFAGLGWMGLLKDLMGKREESLVYYREALKYDQERSMNHGPLEININRQWIEERLKVPFIRTKE